MKKQKYAFEEDYFEGYFLHNVADFSDKSFKRMWNWFRGIFEIVDKETGIKNGHGKKALEFGCALGAASHVLFDFGYEVVATDVSKFAVTKAKQFSPKVTFVQHDIQKSFTKHGKFDLIIALDVIEHLERPDAAVKNLLAIIKKNGKVICSTPNDYEYARKIPSHINVKKPEKWKKIFLDAGFKKVTIKQFTLLPFLYRLHWRLQFGFPFGINMELLPSPVFIIAEK